MTLSPISAPRLAAAALGLMLCAAAPVLAAGEALSGDIVDTSAGPLTIHPVHHASLVLAFGKEVIFIDPVGGAAKFAGLPKPTAILITHAHPDHFDPATLTALDDGTVPILAPQVVADALPAALKGAAKVEGNGASTEIAGVPVAVVPAYNLTAERLKFHPKGVGNGYVFTFGDKKIYVAGDTEDTPEMRALTGIDVAFLPMNLPYTMSEAQAADAVKAFKPKIVYPYHYQGSDPAKFATLVGDAAKVRLFNWYAD